MEMRRGIHAGLSLLAHHLMSISHMAQRQLSIMMLSVENTSFHVPMKRVGEKKLEGPWRGSSLLWGV